ncbi:Protein PLASTID MOVEMENT IMPAIRED 2 [Quillaja saponaria]|uniref:Protein PLASTID MOVEMENT IMPAIRED 2 n=1 Tax=Quillaja saponaria TaxID=32244 RepID=A0AAD7Q6M5_QUISA|nr:Protein PLASTID MOVEMENT IMPAIRED 2 [Quillaja saponaria]
MDEHDDSRRTVGTVKAASNLFGDSNGDISPWPKKSQMNNSEKSSSRTTELHITRRDVGRYRETRKAAESAKVEAESELSNAKKKVKENDDQYAEVMRELVLVKQELQKLKLDVASVLKEKSRAEKEIQESRSNILSRSKSAEAIKKEIEEANEEQVLVELARIEALKEFGDIEAEREKEASQFSTKMENNKKKLKDIIYEIDNSKELEAKLAMTLCDVDVLQNELNLFKEMDRRVRRSGSMKHLEGSFRKEEESETLPSLQTITEELETAKKELASIREEGFQFMGSMDIVRNELNHVISETAQMQKTEEKTELTIQNLNSKLLRASSKLETVSAAEDKAKSIVTNLSVTLQQVKREIEDARKEKELIDEKSIAMKAEIQKNRIRDRYNCEKVASFHARARSGQIIRSFSS